MKTRRTVLLIAFLLISAFLSATETRVTSMGGIGFYMKDNSNIFCFPGTFNSYEGMLISELRIKGSDASYTAGVHLPLFSNIGLYLNNPVYLNIPSSFTRVRIDNTMDFFFGKKLESYDLGIRLAYALDSSKDDYPNTDLEVKESAHYYLLGVGLSNETIDFGVNFELPGAKYEYDTVDETWGGYGFSINYRSFVEQEGYQIVPVITFKMMNTKDEYDYGIEGIDPEKTDYNDISFGLGVGINYELNDQNLLVVGIEPFGMRSNKTKIDHGSETTYQTMIIPGVYAGVESQIKSWLTGRLGFAQTNGIQKETFKPDEGEKTSNSEYFKNFAFTFGLGFEIGKFTLDAFINEDLLFDGPNFISGQEQPVASRLSLTYNFK